MTFLWSKYDRGSSNTTAITAVNSDLRDSQRNVVHGSIGWQYYDQIHFFYIRSMRYTIYTMSIPPTVQKYVVNYGDYLGFVVFEHDTIVAVRERLST